MKRILSLFICLFLLSTLVAQQPRSRTRAAAIQPDTAPVRTDPQFTQQRGDPTPAEIKFEKEMEKARNKERHENLKKDTDKLFKLATELKDGVDKTSKDMLNVEVIKKCEEIEKLAKSVREKMKGY